MFKSLRFRVPALFLAGIVLAGLISTAIAYQLLKDYSRSQSLTELRREARGPQEVHAPQAIKASEKGHAAPAYAGPQREKATGDRLYYVGVPLFPGQSSGLRTLRHLSRSQLDWRTIQAGKTQTFEL